MMSRNRKRKGGLFWLHGLRKRRDNSISHLAVHSATAPTLAHSDNITLDPTQNSRIKRLSKTILMLITTGTEIHPKLVLALVSVSTPQQTEEIDAQLWLSHAVTMPIKA